MKERFETVKSKQLWFCWLSDKNTFGECEIRECDFDACEWNQNYLLHRNKELKPDVQASQTGLTTILNLFGCLKMMVFLKIHWWCVMPVLHKFGQVKRTRLCKFSVKGISITIFVSSIHGTPNRLHELWAQNWAGQCNVKKFFLSKNKVTATLMLASQRTISNRLKKIILINHVKCQQKVWPNQSYFWVATIFSDSPYGVQNWRRD